MIKTVCVFVKKCLGSKVGQIRILVFHNCLFVCSNHLNLVIVIIIVIMIIPLVIITSWKHFHGSSARPSYLRPHFDHRFQLWWVELSLCVCPMNIIISILCLCVYVSWDSLLGSVSVSSHREIDGVNFSSLWILWTILVDCFLSSALIEWSIDLSVRLSDQSSTQSPTGRQVDTRRRTYTQVRVGVWDCSIQFGSYVCVCVLY